MKMGPGDETLPIGTQQKTERNILMKSEERTGCVFGKGKGDELLTERSSVGKNWGIQARYDLKTHPFYRTSAERYQKGGEATGNELNTYQKWEGRGRESGVESGK